MRNIKLKRLFLSIAIILAIIFPLAGCSSIKDGNKVQVGISWSTDEVDKDSKDKVDADTQVYADAVRKAGGNPVFLPEFKSKEDAIKGIEDVDCIIVTGGEDLNPKLYNEEKIPELEELNTVRDSSDVNLINACLEKDKTTLATCRGMQLTNILSGGTLCQDIISQRPTDIVHRDPEKKIYVRHNIDVLPDNILSKTMDLTGEVEVNSWHHQAIKDLGNNLSVLATAPDGTIESIKRDDKTFFLGIQWHPEELITGHDDKNALKFYQNYFKTAKELNKESK